VYGYNYAVATDWSGNPWQYSQPSNTWTQIGGPGDQFVVDGVSLAGLTLDHAAIYNFTVDAGGNGQWLLIGGNAAQLYGNGNYTLAKGLSGLPLAATKDIFTWVPGTTTWLHQGGPGYMFAMIDPVANNAAPQLFGSVPNQSQVWKSDNITISNPSWTLVGGAATRLVGQGGKLYATNGIVL
jgi:hypothetical protein